VRLHRGTIRFNYLAKGGLPRTLALRDAALHRVVNSLLRRRGGGDELLAYRVRRDWRNVRAEDLNATVKELAGEQYTCKDLRTWNATVLAAMRLAAAEAQDRIPAGAAARRRVVSQTIKEVSEHLGNTPAVARSAYVDPRVVERFEAGRTILAALRRTDAATAAPGPIDDADRTVIDRAVVRLITD
jgi:DNA topoisomerase I